MAVNPNADEEQEAKRKTMMVAIPLLGGAYVLSSLLCTYLVAMDVNFNPVLGGVEIFGLHFYSPFAYSDWREDEMIARAIPDILAQYKWYRLGIMAVAAGIVYLVNQANKRDISHGSAEFASNKDITLSDLGHYVTHDGGVFDKDENGKKIIKKSGVVVGRNPYNKEIMLHDGPEHVLLMAPTRSGKGVNTIIPTGLVWKASIFFFDPKGELWAQTSGYRKNKLKQKVMKFEPLCIDGSTNRWNPLAEINFRTNEEISDVSMIVGIMVKPDGEKKGGGDPFWDNSAINLLNGVVMHLMYKHYKENLPLPSPTDIMSFLSSPDKNTDELFEDMMTYPHITPEEFLEREHPVIKLDYLGNPCKNPDGSFIYEQEVDDSGKPVVDEQGKPVYKKECYANPLREIYGEYYVRDLKKINDSLTTLTNSAIGHNKLDREKLAQQYPNLFEKNKMGKFMFRSLAKTISEIRDNIRFAMDVAGVKDDNTLTDAGEPSKICWAVRDDEEFPFHRLLTHPRVAEQAAVMKNGAEQTRASIMQTAQTALGVYGDPLVQNNMSVSDFCIRDLLDPRQEISVYLVMQVKDIATVRPIARLFINIILDKLIRDMKFEQEKGQKKAKKQRLLLMLDEFPQLGNMSKVETALAICAGYGIKFCIVCQDVNQLNKTYTKDNSIASNCHVHIYFTPNLDTGGATAEAISKTLGKKTIKSISRSDGGGGFGKGSNSISSQARDLMTPDEVARMSTEEEIVFVAGQKPIKGGKLRYYKEPWFIDKVNANPPPKLSDQVTRIETYGELFRLHEADTLERKAKIAEIAQAKRERAEKEREANATVINEEPAKTVDADTIRTEVVKQEKEILETVPAAPEKLAVTVSAGRGELAPSHGSQPTQEARNEDTEEKPVQENREEAFRDEKPGEAQETESPPTQGTRGKDEEQVVLPRRRIPHGRSIALPSRKVSHNVDGPPPNRDEEAVNNRILELRNVYMAFNACYREDTTRALQLANKHNRLVHEVRKAGILSPQLEAQINRQTSSIANVMDDLIKPPSSDTMTSMPQQASQATQGMYEKPETEEVDPATASILSGVEEKSGEPQDSDTEENEFLKAQVGSPLDVFNNMVAKDKEGDSGNGTGESGSL